MGLNLGRIAKGVLTGGISEVYERGLKGGAGDKLAQEDLQSWKDLELPDIEQMKVQLQQQVASGQMTAEQAEAALVESDAYQNMQLDTQGKDAQMAALQSLQDLGNNGGLSASDRADLQRIQTQEDTASRGAREAILRDAQARGAGGSGGELLAQLTNAQSSANRQSQRDLDVAGMAQKRALEALQGAGKLGGDINQQVFGQQAAIADSANAIQKFNAANKQQTGIYNTGARNDAQRFNIDNTNTINAKNTDITNAQEVQNKGLTQQQFDNELKKKTGQTNASQSAAEAAEARNKANRELAGGVIQGATTMFAKSDERCKEDVEPFDASAFLDDLTGYKYRYKDTRDGKGNHAGVMAQDLEKSDIGRGMVHDTDEGKVVDTKKATMASLGALADLHERLKKLEGK